MTKKKILYVITKSVWGGAQRYVFDLATNLPADKFEAVVAAGGNGQLIDKLKEKNIKTIAIPRLERDVNAASELLSLWRLFKIFRQEKPDVIHLNSSKVGGLGAIAAFAYKLLNGLSFLNSPRKKSITVFTAHGWAFNEDRTRLSKRIIIFLTKFAAIFQDKIIVINAPDLKAAKDLKIANPDKIKLIPNGIGPINFLPREEARRFFSEIIGAAPNNYFLIGTIAELTKNKGIEFLLEAAGQLKQSEKNFKIVVMGDGEERVKLQNKIKLLGLGGVCFLPGFVPEATRYLKAIDAFAFPSVKEGLPYAILEAMSAGLPIISTDVGGIPDMIKPGENGLLAPSKNPSAMKEAIETILQNEGIRRKFGENAVETIKTKFKLSDMIQKTASLYSDD